jgi:hypothetical protein
MSIELYTYKDAYDHVVDVFDVDTTGREGRNVRRAILAAYRALPNVYKWRYYERRYSIRSEASVSDGSVAYTHSTRTVTLTGDTFPTNADLYRIYFASDQAHYPIESYGSSTTVTLSEQLNPGADVVAGTSYICYRASYPFPSNFRKIDKAWDVIGNYAIDYRDPPEALGHSIWYQTPSTPTIFTINAGDSDYYGALTMTLSPPPSTARTYEFNYQAGPRPLRVFSESTGTIDHGAASTTVTGTGTAFSAANHEGAVIRFSSDSSTVPTDREGDNPYTAYRIVDEVASTTSLTIDAVPGIGASGVKYSISDPLDFTTDTMHTYFLRACEAQFALLTKREDRAEYVQLAMLALQEAAGGDSRNRNSSSGSVQHPFHWRGWSTVPDEVVNASPT